MQPLGIWKKTYGVLAFSSAVRGALPFPFPLPFSPLAFGAGLGSATSGDVLPLPEGDDLGGTALAGAPATFGVGFVFLETLGFSADSMDNAFWSSRSSTKYSCK